MAFAPAPPVERFQKLVARLESIDDDEARGIAEELVGTMLEVAGGRRSVADFARLLTGRPRAEAGKNAPSHGLYLAAVRY